MANEHTLMVETHVPESFTVADGTGIERGALCKLTDPNTAILSDGDEDICAGVAATEKIASDGVTSLGFYRRGVFKAKACGSIAIGDALITNSSSGGSNTLSAAGVNAENIVGTSRETATEGQTFLYELNPKTINVA